MTKTSPSVPRTSQEMAQERTDYAYERTQMAATRTYFALLRTGLAIAGGGSLVTTILASGYPDWVIGLLSAVFIVVGYAIMIGALRRHRALAKRLAVHEDFEAVPIQMMTIMTVLLMVTMAVVLVLYLLG